MKGTAKTRKVILPGMTLALSLLLMPLANTTAFAADAPPDVETIDMSDAVGNAVNAIIALINEQKLGEAETAMQALRTTLESMTDYEKRVVLQISVDLNTRLVKYPEAIADHEALLQTAGLSDAERLTSADLAGQLYLQVRDWNKGLEHLLAVNTLQGGNNMETLFRIAFAHSQLGQTTAAIPFMEQALSVGGAQAPENFYRNMAVLYMQAASPAKAITTYEKMLETYPTVADRERLTANIAALYIDVGDNARARTVLQALLREYPSSDQAATYRQSLAALNGGRP